MSAPSCTQVVKLAAFAPKAQSPVLSTTFQRHSELQQNRTMCGHSLNLTFQDLKLTKCNPSGIGRQHSHITQLQYSS